MQTATMQLGTPTTTTTTATPGQRSHYQGGYTWVPLPVADSLAIGLVSLGYAVAQAYAALPLHVRTQVHAHTCQLAGSGNVAAAQALLHMWGG